MVYEPLSKIKDVHMSTKGSKLFQGSLCGKISMETEAKQLFEVASNIKKLKQSCGSKKNEGDEQALCILKEILTNRTTKARIWKAIQFSAKMKDNFDVIKAVLLPNRFVELNCNICSSSERDYWFSKTPDEIVSIGLKESQIGAMKSAVSTLSCFHSHSMKHIWDPSFVLPLCMEAKFYEACGLIHYIRGEFVAALDRYIQGSNEPIHALSFLNKLFLELDSSEALLFQSTVLSWIPDLVKISRHCNFFLFFAQLDSEKLNILSLLHSHSASLLLYLKTLIDFHTSGTLSFLVNASVLVSNYSNVRMRNSPIDIANYLEKLSNFPKLLHHDSIHVTDVMIEKYLELFCQFEDNFVLEFLETFDNYRLEHCLKLYQDRVWCYRCRCIFARKSW